ncbi:hypothetical protein [Hydrogenophaga sp.]|uniref:hypothetical protein n=1 Tax=Hydrogenophaga sp. TaxID=1904254 RepID=UPI002FC793CE
MRAPILMAAATLLLAAGCATETAPASMPASKSGAISDITVRVEPTRLAPQAQGLPRVAKVEVSDIRQRVHSERTTIGGVSMGRIVIEPDELEIVRALVQAKADAALARLRPRSVPTIYVGVREFGVLTPATVLYWDVTAKVDLVLRVGGQDRVAAGAKTERTYWWPSEELVQGVTDEALRQVAAQAEKALAELLSGG